MHTGRPPHLKTFDDIGLHRYFLTFCPYERGHLFTTHERVALVLSQILRAAQGERFAVLTGFYFRGKFGEAVAAIRL
jgi:hypothetical protein